MLELNCYLNFLIFLLRVSDVLNHKLAVRVLAVLLDGLGDYQSPLRQRLGQRLEVEIDLEVEINDLGQDYTSFSRRSRLSVMCLSLSVQCNISIIFL